MLNSYQYGNDYHLFNYLTLAKRLFMMKNARKQSIYYQIDCFEMEIPVNFTRLGAIQK